LNRPAQANALDWEMGQALESAVSRIKQREDVRVVMLRGSGQHFCSGGDFAFIEENTRLDAEQVRARMLRFYQMYLSIVDVPVPTLAVLHGSAIGAGLCLALACDLRLGTASARLSVNFVRLGLHPGMGATALLPHLLGSARARQLLLTGEVLNGEQAAALGLLTQVVSPEDLAASADHVAKTLASAAPLAVRDTTETLRAPLRSLLAAALPREAACQAANFGTEDVKRAIEAFRQKQQPTFIGR
jgi:enoyl-CoA hydratase